MRPDVDAFSLQRVVVLGSTGSGKTTLASTLAQHLGATHVELDALRHGPNWVETPDEVFRKLAQAATNQSTWVVDGNYSQVREVIWPHAQVAIWLDYSFGLTAWRLVKRTLVRCLRREQLWNGNRERLFTHLATRDSIFWWLIKTYSRRRRELPEAMAHYPNLKVVHLRSPAETRDWLQHLRSMSEGHS